jgi:FMN phosphatase YigB (HAD superfamily)
MTNEQAIDLLDNLIGMVTDSNENDYDTALKMGIKALKELEWLDKQVNNKENKE